MDELPAFVAYHRSINTELEAIKDRVRYLIKHWPTDGAFKESILRSVLRRHLPESLQIGTGFVVTSAECSTQVDILIVDKSRPRLFSDGDFVIVTREAVRAVIEVKTGYDRPTEIEGDVLKLGRNAEISRWTGHKQFAGMFIYEARGDYQDVFLRALRKVRQDCGRDVHCVAYGSDLFIDKPGGIGQRSLSGWVSRSTGGMAGAYFIGKLVEFFSEESLYSDPVAWQPMVYKAGVARHLPCEGDALIEEIKLADCFPPCDSERTGGLPAGGRWHRAC
jgi:hypothetical protein